jgi:hypothetical protein
MAEYRPGRSPCPLAAGRLATAEEHTCDLNCPSVAWMWYCSAELGRQPTDSRLLMRHQRNDVHECGWWTIEPSRVDFAHGVNRGRYVDRREWTTPRCSSRSGRMSMGMSTSLQGCSLTVNEPR